MVDFSEKIFNLKGFNSKFVIFPIVLNSYFFLFFGISPAWIFYSGDCWILFLNIELIFLRNQGNWGLKHFNQIFSCRWDQSEIYWFLFLLRLLLNKALIGAFTTNLSYFDSILDQRNFLIYYYNLEEDNTNNDFWTQIYIYKKFLTLDINYTLVTFDLFDLKI